MQDVSFIGKALPLESAITHFCFIGATGSGKTVSIRLLMQTAFASIGKGFGHRALVYDAKRDMLPILQGIVSPELVFTLNPFDKRSVAWDMAKDITTPAHALQLANILIPPEKNASQPFFADAARHLLSGVITAFICLENDWTFRDVVLAMLNKTALIGILESVEETKNFVDLYFSHEGTAQNIMSTVATKMNPYSIIAALWHYAFEEGKKISLTEWIKQERVLILGNEHTNRVAVDAINQAIFKRLSEIILDQDDISHEHFSNGNTPPLTWVVFDEFVRAGKFDGMVELATEGRSKGVAIVLGFQDIDGARAVYGKEVAEEIVGQCTNIAILRLQSPETAEWASKLFGSYEKLEEEYGTNESESNSLGVFALLNKGNATGSQVTWRKQIRQAVLSSEFLTLPMTNLDNGLKGFLFSPYFSSGKYLIKREVSGKELFSNLRGKSKTAGVIRRSGKEQFLPSWKLEDWMRLKLENVGKKYEEQRAKEFARDEIFFAGQSPEENNFSSLSVEGKKVFWVEYGKIEIEERRRLQQEREDFINQIIEIWAYRNLNQFEQEQLNSLKEDERERIFLEVAKRKGGNIPYEKKPDNSGLEGFEKGKTEKPITY